MRVSTISAFLLTSNIIFADCQNASERIYVADYSGKVHTVRYDPPTLPGVQGNLIVIQSADLCGPKPSWLFKGPNRERLWCIGEGAGFAAGLNHYTIAADGKLGILGGKTVVGAPVHAAFAFNDSGVLTAQYGGMNGSGSGGGVTFWKFENENIQDVKVPDQRVFPNLAKPGDSPQDVPRAHQVVPDPSGRFAVVPDLGADKLRVLGVDTSGMAVLDELEYQLPKGTGPRHAVFPSTLRRQTPPQLNTSSRQRARQFDYHLQRQLSGRPFEPDLESRAVSSERIQARRYCEHSKQLQS
jgi:6-phosphogluconolactonase (cycloisomerase 2 family)